MQLLVAWRLDEGGIGSSSKPSTFDELAGHPSFPEDFCARFRLRGMYAQPLPDWGVFFKPGEGLRRNTDLSNRVTEIHAINGRS